MSRLLWLMQDVHVVGLEQVWQFSGHWLRVFISKKVIVMVVSKGE
jgi:hypothetical protein